MNKLRENTPKRKSGKIVKKYKYYKKELQADFEGKCGYCNDNDVLIGGKNSFHIDHFKPQKHFANLKDDYNNLVYSCQMCNLSKKDFWDDSIYIDPCDDKYDLVFVRDKFGKIVCKDDKYIDYYNRLKLYMKRHQIIYQLNLLYETLNALDNIIQKKEKNGENIEVLYVLTSKLGTYHRRYLKELYKII